MTRHSAEYPDLGYAKKSHRHSNGLFTSLTFIAFYVWLVFHPHAFAALNGFLSYWWTHG